MPPEPPTFLTTDEAADYLGLSSVTLKRWRSDGRGPPYITLEGSIRYDLVALHAWVEANTSNAKESPQ